MKIPVLDLSPEIETHWQEFTEAIQKVLRSAQFINGPEVKALETEVAEYLGIKHAVGVNSGTDAIVIGLRAMGVKPGDEVIAPSFTFFATAEAISQVGATPVFADINPKTFNLNPESVEASITSKTKALVPVHLYGYPADMDSLRQIAQKHNLRILEDTAQAFGARYQGKKVGTLGNVGAFSFFPSKNLGAFGDGGMIVTDDDSIAEASRMLRVHGSRKKYYNECLGYNSRLDAVQAAILRVKLTYIDKSNEGRRQAASRYNELLNNHPKIQTPTQPENGEHVFHQYTIRLPDNRRDTIHASLKELGIQTMIYYPVPIHQMSVYNMSVHLPNTETAAREVLSLPIWPGIQPEIQIKIAEEIKKLLE